MEQKCRYCGREIDTRDFRCQYCKKQKKTAELWDRTARKKKNKRLKEENESEKNI